MKFHGAGRVALIVLIQLSLLCLLASANNEPITIGGDIYYQANLRTNTAGITVMHSKGVAFIDYLSMPTEEERIQFGYDADLYVDHKNREIQRNRLEHENRQVREKNAARVRHAAARAIQVEVEIKRRQGIYVFAEGDIVEFTTEKIKKVRTVERLKGPGMTNRNEKRTTFEIVPVKIREPILKGLLIIDRQNLLPVNTRWDGILYPASFMKNGLPVYAIAFQDLLQQDKIQDKANPPYIDLGEGFWHGVSIPLRLARIGGLRLRELNARSPLYLSGLALGVISLPALLFFLVLKTRKRKKPVPVQILPWEK